MENLSPRALSRKRRHKSHCARSGREYKSRKYPLKECTEARKTADCYITQNRLTMRMGLFNKGKASDIILRTDGGGDRGGGGDDFESRWQKVALYQAMQGTTFGHQPKTKENHLSKENRDYHCAEQETKKNMRSTEREEERIVSSAVDEDRTGAADMWTSNRLPSSPGIEKLSLFLTEHIDPKCVMPSGYLQRARKCLQEQYKAVQEKVEEEKENLECLAQTEPGLQWKGIHETCQHNAPSHATEKTEDAAATVALWWSSSPGARRFDFPPAASTSMPPPPYLSQNPIDTTRPSSSSSQLGNVKEFWSGAGDGSMHNHVHVVSQPLLNITDAKRLQALNDFVCCAKQSSCAAATSVPLSGLQSFDNPASGPSSSEWAVDLDHGCLKYIHQSTRKNSNVPYFNQTDRERDILDIAETNQMSADYLLQLSSDHSNDKHATMATADCTEEHQTELVGGFMSLKNSQGSLDETLGSWEMHLPKLLLATVHSPSPQQKYYRRKVF